ncbi:unnamed protein product [Caenorhabditis angaria]|uniref:DUF7869 domain-containing protein n=1 Tax=Caenorhabditis angaria TaxID=860376 RepID=A0A9P1N566_9PELO|nr:unnamed protein product [Caenorhabditis angaria]
MDEVYQDFAEGKSFGELIELSDDFISMAKPRRRTSPAFITTIKCCNSYCSIRVPTIQEWITRPLEEFVNGPERRQPIKAKKTSTMFANAVHVLMANTEPHPTGGRFCSDTLKKNFTKCNVCSALKNAFTKTIEKEVVYELQNEHCEEVFNDRTVVELMEIIARQPNKNTILIKLDAMGKERTKMPIINDRPKCIDDTSRMAYNVVVFQSPNTGSTLYKNAVYTMLGDLYPKSSSFYSSLLCNYLSTLSTVPSDVIIVLDNARCNKSEEFVGFMGYLMLILKEINSVTLCYMMVGHSHTSVDGYFGLLTRHFSEKNTLSPHEFDNRCLELASTQEVRKIDTIYDFSPIKGFLNKINNRATHHLVKIFRYNDKISISVGKYIRSDAFSPIGQTKSDVIPLFKDETLLSDFKPAIVLPNLEQAKCKLERLLKSSASFFTMDQRKSYESSLCSTRIEWENLLQRFSEIPRNLPLVLPPKSKLTVVEYLEQHGYQCHTNPKPLSIDPELAKQINK